MKDCFHWNDFVQMKLEGNSFMSIQRPKPSKATSQNVFCFHAGVSNYNQLPLVTPLHQTLQSTGTFQRPLWEEQTETRGSPLCLIAVKTDKNWLWNVLPLWRHRGFDSEQRRHSFFECLTFFFRTIHLRHRLISLKVESDAVRHRWRMTSQRDDQSVTGTTHLHLGA